ncbi:EfeM/EfeO family lipoprotein [Streptomyces orinoci]|uniref:EfeM/EfeO family lipoprotein n=1 Tax=Streptomyces orinoci TaxID=67339 RepID=A0ABV3K8P3_STRON|nr:EfeM/EfeO family lipoprotein [Streptomyces orinoci]
MPGSPGRRAGRRRALALALLALATCAAPARPPGKPPATTAATADTTATTGTAPTVDAKDTVDAQDTVDITPGTCGTGWQHPRPGPQRFALRNGAAVPVDARLTDPRTGAVYGEVEGVAPGTTRPLRVRLGAGSYAFACLPEDGDAVTGPVVRLGGHAAPGPAARPVTRAELIPATLDYQRWTARQLAGLARATAALRTAIDHGDRAAARRAWLTAHLGYARLGGAYGAFGAAGRAVDGTTAGLPGGVHDPRFTGFHRLEYGLWHGEDGPALRRCAARLDADVRALGRTWDQTRPAPEALVRRVQEIPEDTLHLELAGRTDYGSGTGRATAGAQLDATERVLEPLVPLLRTRYPGLAELRRRLARTRRDLEHAQHRRLDADFGDLVERLAEVAAVCAVRRAA